MPKLYKDPLTRRLLICHKDGLIQHVFAEYAYNPKKFNSSCHFLLLKKNQ